MISKRVLFVASCLLICNAVSAAGELGRLLPLSCVRVRENVNECKYEPVTVAHGAPIPGHIYVYSKDDVDALIKGQAAACSKELEEKAALLAKRSADLEAILARILHQLDQLPRDLATDPEVKKKFLEQLILELDERYQKKDE